ncbi:MAG: polysaccharide lyase, partial [Alistipes sp.]
MNFNALRATAFGLSLTLLPAAGGLFAQELVPILPRVNVQADSARLEQVVDGEWVAVGTRKAHAIQHDYTRPYDGKPSYRFELKADDNTLAGYAPGETKGRAELSFCYATAADWAGRTAEDYDAAHRMKTVYHQGKGIAPQGSSREYRFAVYIPDDLSPDVCTIFAQWHGMPDRTLTQSPEGMIRRLTAEEFLELESRMVFKKDTGYDKLGGVDKKGRPLVAREPNGWKVEQGGYPPLAFGFQQGLFYIKANSDRRWLPAKGAR